MLLLVCVGHVTGKMADTADLPRKIEIFSRFITELCIFQPKFKIRNEYL